VDAHGNLTGLGNLISGNGVPFIVPSNGIYIADFNAASHPAANNVIQGNFIGVDVTGAQQMGNSNAGITLGGGANTHTIGGTNPGEGNVISGNTNFGVQMLTGTPFGNATGNVVEGNFIGTDVTGSTTTGTNGQTLGDQVGVYVANGAVANTIGGTTAGAR